METETDCAWRNSRKPFKNNLPIIKLSSTNYFQTNLKTPVWWFVLNNVGYSQNGCNLGGFTYRAGHLLQSAVSAASSQALLSWFSVLLAGKEPSHRRKYSRIYTSSRLNADFCFQRAKIWEKYLRKPQSLVSVGNLWRSSGHWRRHFGKTELILMHGVTLRSQGSQCVFNLQEDFLLVKFDSQTKGSWTPAAVSNFCGSCHSTPDMSGSESARSGRRGVAVHVRRWQKPITTNTSLEQPKRKMLNLFLGKTKEEQNQSKGIASGRQPQSGSTYTALCTVECCSESNSAHCCQSEKNENILHALTPLPAMQWHAYNRFHALLSGNLALLFLRLQYFLNVFKFWSFVKSLSMPIESLLTTIFFLETKSLPPISTKRYASEPNLPKLKLLLPNTGRFNRHCLSIEKTPNRQRSGKLTMSSRLAGWSPRLC